MLLALCLLTLAADLAPLSKAEAVAARDRLWKEHVATTTKDRAAELKVGKLIDGKLEMPIFTKTFGEKPKTGRSLWISLHGGGGAPTKLNDGQWENQKKLYTVAEGVYVAPRAPTNTWNLWHEAHIDRLFARLIEDFVAVEGVNPDKVYLMGYSAGGDGVYQMAPRMADWWAAASMMAGPPTDAKHDAEKILPDPASEDSGIAHTRASAPIACQGRNQGVTRRYTAISAIAAGQGSVPSPLVRTCRTNVASRIARPTILTSANADPPGCSTSSPTSGALTTRAAAPASEADVRVAMETSPSNVLFPRQ